MSLQNTTWLTAKNIYPIDKQSSDTRVGTASAILPEIPFCEWLIFLEDML